MLNSTIRKFSDQDRKVMVEHFKKIQQDTNVLLQFIETDGNILPPKWLDKYNEVISTVGELANIISSIPPANK